MSALMFPVSQIGGAMLSNAEGLWVQISEPVCSQHCL